MRSFLIVTLCILGTYSLVAQSKLQVVTDSVRVLNSELVLRNGTRNTQGILYNKGNGITEFRALKVIKSGDSTFIIIGHDTISINAGTTGAAIYEGEPDISLAAMQIDQTHMKLNWWKTSNDLYESARIGIIGDSQGKGDYPSAYDYSIFGRLQRYLYAVANNIAITNYCQNGYNSRKLSPAGSNPYVDNQYNITKALQDGNKIIILCNTSNDFSPSAAGGYTTIAESMANTLLIADACAKAGATLFVVSSFPREQLSAGFRDTLDVMAGLLNRKFGNRCAYVYRLIEDSANADNLNPTLEVGDNIHLNDAGSNIVYSAVRDMLTSYYTSNTSVSKYQLQRSASYNGNFHDYQFINTPNIPSAILNPDSNYYRVRIQYNNGYFSKWSNVIQGPLAHSDSVFNQKPLLSVTSPQTILLPASTVTLTANASDPNTNGSIVSYHWVKISGNAVTITSPSAASTTVTGLIEGSYVFRCEVTNNASLSSYADVPVTVVIVDSTNAAAKFNFNKAAQSVMGWIDVSGGPLLAANNGKVWTDVLHNISLVNISNSTAVWGSDFYTNSGDENGAFTPDAGGHVIPAAVMNSVWYSHYMSYANAASNQMKLTGLSPIKKYKLRFYCSLESSFNLDADPTVVVVNNNLLNQKQVNAVGNTSKVIIFRGITPNVDGEIPFFVGVPSGSAEFGMINGLTIETDSLTTTPVGPELTAPANMVITLPLNSAALTVTANDPYAELVSVLWTKISGPSGSFFSNTSSLQTTVASLTEGTYVFRCTVGNNYGQSSYKDIQVTVNPVSNNPTLRIGVSAFNFAQSGWKVLAGQPYSLVTTLNDTIAATPVIISTVNTANWVPLFGNSTADSSGQDVSDAGGSLAPLRVQKGAFFNINSYDPAKPQVSISGLPAGTYKVTMLGSLKTSIANSLSADCNTQFRVNGGTAVVVDTKGNTSQAAVIEGITISAGGTINLFFNPVTGGSNYNVGMLNFFTIEKTN